MHDRTDSREGDDGPDGYGVRADSGFDDRDGDAADADHQAHDHEFCGVGFDDHASVTFNK